jgi:hypothetical protein
MAPTLYEVALIGGVAFAGTIKMALKYGWRRLTASPAPPAARSRPPTCGSSRRTRPPRSTWPTRPRPAPSRSRPSRSPRSRPARAIPPNSALDPSPGSGNGTPMTPRAWCPQGAITAAGSPRMSARRRDQPLSAAVLAHARYPVVRAYRERSAVTGRGPPGSTCPGLPGTGPGGVPGRDPDLPLPLASLSTAAARASVAWTWAMAAQTAAAWLSAWPSSSAAFAAAFSAWRKCCSAFIGLPVVSLPGSGVIPHRPAL